MAICDHQRCKRTADVAPKIVVPHAVGAPFDPRRQIGVLLELKLCRRCCLHLSPAVQAAYPNFVEFARGAARQQAKKLGLPYQEPDLARARIERVKLGSDEYRRLAPHFAKMPASPGTKGE
jgi:hypothetical protein